MQTLLLKRADVAALLDMRECIDAVERAYRLHAGGTMPPPGILGMHVDGGGFHVKAAALPGARSYFAAKTNANFPDNPRAHGLPTIQGAILLFDAADGRLLAIMDSAEVTALRTGATTGVATRHLARASASTVTLVGCGAQAGAQLCAVAAVRDLRRVLVSDIDPARAARFAQQQRSTLGIPVDVAGDLPGALAGSEICITCTPSRRFIVERSWVHHAIDSGDITRDRVHAELGEVVAGHKPGRQNEAEAILFDSSGVALGDVAAAALVYERALERRRGESIRLTD